MKAETRKKVSLTMTKALQKCHKNNKRNNTNSTSCNNSGVINISRDNYKPSV